MNPWRISFVLLLGLGGAALPGRSLAQDIGSRWERMKARFDTDGDGQISTGEFSGPAMLFRRMDRNGDGMLEEAEANQMPARKNRPGGHPRPGANDAPGKGTAAPDVSATGPDGQTVPLAKPPRPTVLVFGSHT